MKFLDYLEKEKPYTICFCDGNHENFPAIYEYPQEEWNGGKIHRIRKNIIHLMRGQIYKIENKTFFVFGGAYSIDKGLRVEGRSWWSEELPTKQEYDIGFANLEKHNFKVDYIITHTAPQAIIEILIAKQQWNDRANFKMDFHDYKLLEFLGEVLFKTQFKHWYFGHWHFDTSVDEKSTALYSDVRTLP